MLPRLKTTKSGSWNLTDLHGAAARHVLADVKGDGYVSLKSSGSRWTRGVCRGGREEVGDEAGKGRGGEGQLSDMQNQRPGKNDWTTMTCSGQPDVASSTTGIPVAGGLVGGVSAVSDDVSLAAAAAVEHCAQRVNPN